MAFPTTDILFDFTTNDAAPMTGWTDIANGVSAAGGIGVGSVTTDINVSKTTASYGPDAEGYFTIVTKPSNGNGLGVAVRIDGSNAGYFVTVQTASGTDSVLIFRIDAGPDFTQLGSTISQEFSVGDALGIEVIGTSNNIKAYRKPSGGSWGQIGTTQSDGTYTAAGKLQLEIDFAGQVDDFGGGTVVTASGRSTRNTRACPLGIAHGMDFGTQRNHP